MSHSIWIQEARRRNPNDPWGEWEQIKPHQTTTAYGSKPSTKTSYPNTYQLRIVEYKRVEPEDV
jgi:hypothetical protein